MLFVGSAAAAGSGAALIIASSSVDAMRENGPAVRLGALGAAVELVAGRVLEKRLDRLPGGHRRRLPRWARPGAGTRLPTL